MNLVVEIPGAGKMALSTFDRLRRAAKNANGKPIWLDKSETGLQTKSELRWRTAENLGLADLREHGERYQVTLTLLGEMVLNDGKPFFK